MRAAAEVERRMSELRMDRTALAKAAGVDRKTVDNFLNRGARPNIAKRGGYEQALGWVYGSLTDVARGGRPTPLPNVGVDQAIGEADVLRWLHEHLPRELGNHIVRQYHILKAAAEAGASPPVDPTQGSPTSAGARMTPDEDPDEDPDLTSHIPG